MFELPLSNYFVAMAFDYGKSLGLNVKARTPHEAKKYVLDRISPTLRENMTSIIVVHQDNIDEKIL